MAPKGWFKKIRWAKMRIFRLTLSEYQYERLTMEAGHSHQDAEQIVRQAMARYWGDDRR